MSELLPTILAALQAPATTLGAQLDVSRTIWGAVAVLITALVGTVRLLARMIVRRFEEVTVKVDGIDRKVDKVSRDVQTVHHEMFGPTGQNGVRSDVRRISRQMGKHERVLIELAVRHNIEIPEEE